MIPFQILKLSIVRKNKISVPLRKKCQPPKVQFSINILRKIWKRSVGSGWLHLLPFNFDIINVVWSSLFLPSSF